MLQKPASRRFEARRGLGETRRGLGEATPRTQNALAQGQSEAHRDSKLYNTIVEVPGRLRSPIKYHASLLLSHTLYDCICMYTDV